MGGSRHSRREFVAQLCGSCVSRRTSRREFFCQLSVYSIATETENPTAGRARNGEAGSSKIETRKGTLPTPSGVGAYV
jgi:hypothetical protein